MIDLEITIVQNSRGAWIATCTNNVPGPVTASGSTPQQAYANLAMQINFSGG